jgi:hypothetical protein
MLNSHKQIYTRDITAATGFIYICIIIESGNFNNEIISKKYEIHQIITIFMSIVDDWSVEREATGVYYFSSTSDVSFS